MPSINDLSDGFLERLRWFEEHEGKQIGWPKPIGQRQLNVMSQAKGIYKPRGEHYSLSVRVGYRRKYGGGPKLFDDGSWQLIYHREERKGDKDPLAFDTNAGLMMCLNNRIPIGVAHQISDTPKSRYRIYGLGLVTDYADFHFVIEGPVSLNANLETDDLVPPLPISMLDLNTDDRQKVLAELVRRRGQGKFRQELLLAYGEACAVTGCQILEVLEAAHIIPHRGTSSNHIQNGILLRADIHSLFDRGLISIEPITKKVRLAPALKDDPTYGRLDGLTIALPRAVSQQPSDELLKLIQPQNREV